jgi:transglutaminase-like putative cysteine protease
LAGALFLAAAAPAAEPTPGIAPVPSWVEPVAVPAGALRKDQPVQFVVTSAQMKFTADGSESYLEYVAVPQTTAGLQAIGTVTLPWNVERTDLTLHRIAIRRGGQTIDLLNPSELLVLRRENNLEKATLDGLRTVVLPAKGLQVGDQLVVAASYRTKASAIAFRPEEVQTESWPEIMTRVEQRVVVPSDVPMRLSRSPGSPEPVVRKLADATEYRLVVSGKKEAEYPIGTPDRFTKQYLQFSGWSAWDEVASRMQPLFTAARNLGPGTAVAGEADKIAALSQDGGARMLAALRLAQEQVRYVALVLGEGAYRPSTADETWERRFGDCKGKTALLLSLLDRFGIEAQPMLVSVENDDGLGERLPSLDLFDHVIVRARLNNRIYYLDATDYGQRTLDELSRTSFTHGLVLQPGATLIKLDSGLPSVPLAESELVWDGSGGFERKVPFTATLTLRGESASAMRAKKNGSTDADKFAKKLKNLMPGVSNDHLVIKSEEPEQPDGSYVVRFAGTAAMDWSPLEGLKGHRFEFDHSAVKWKADFERSEGPNKDLPLALSYPFYQRATEVIVLPKGGRGFRVEAKPIDERYAGVHVTRTVSQAGDRVVARSEFRPEAREVPAAAARSAEPVMERLNGEFAYVVAPGRIRPVGAEK